PCRLAVSVAALGFLHVANGPRHPSTCFFEVLMRIWILRLTVVIGLVAASPVITAQTAAQDAAPAQAPPTLVVFSAMGDIPYDPHEDEILKKQIAELPEEAEFVIHVGDIKRGKSVPCEATVYAKVAGMLAASAKPVR